MGAVVYRRPSHNSRYREELQERLWEWREGFDRAGGLKVNAGKTKVMISSKQGVDQIHIVDRRDEVLKQVETFKNLGAVISA